LLVCVVERFDFKAVNELLEHVRCIGRRLTAAQPRELVVGNIIRRVLGLIREVTENSPNNDTNNDQESTATKSSGPPSFLRDVLVSSISAAATPPNYHAPNANGSEFEHHDLLSMKDVKDDVLNGMQELLDELDQADEQIAGYGVEHIHANEVILTYTSSMTVQKFLLQVARKRKFTVIQVEGYPNEHEETHATVISGRKKGHAEDMDYDARLKSLTAAGINVVVVPDSAVFAIMARVNKVILPAHSVLSNGGLVAAAGTNIIAHAANFHHTPVIVIGAIYKLSPLYPYDEEALIEYGDSGKVFNYQEGDLVESLEVINPIHDYVPPELVDLFITNM